MLNKLKNNNNHCAASLLLQNLLKIYVIYTLHEFKLYILFITISQPSTLLIEK